MLKYGDASSRVSSAFSDNVVSFFIFITPVFVIYLAVCNGEALLSFHFSRRGVNSTLHILGMGEVVFGVPNGKNLAKRKKYTDKERGFDGGVSEKSKIVTLQIFLFQVDSRSGFQGHP